jgi:polysaccharide deacetylase 2 family uncharacterized protein YibQ
MRPSPAQTAALIGVAALVLLLGIKLVGIIHDGAWKDIVARKSDGAKHALGRIGGGDGDREAEESPVVTGLVSALKPFGIPVAKIERRKSASVISGRGLVEHWDVPVPARVSLVQVNMAVAGIAPELGVEVLDAWEEEGAGGAVLKMTLGVDKEERYRLAFGRQDEAGPVKGVVAIVVNGIGANWDATSEALLAFEEPISWGVLPGMRSSRDIARAARARGIEVLLSLPMEPKRYPQVDPGEDAILVHLTAAEVRARMRRALSSVGEVEGIVSYMGGMAATDPDLMRVVLDEVNRQDLFFVDSVVEQSRATEVARQLGTRAIASTLFIDDEDASQDDVARRLDRLMDIAARDGEAVAIGHSYPQTLAALSAALPEFAARGLKLVPVSNLVPARAPAAVAGSM